MQTIPGAMMVYNNEPGIAGAEIVYPNGSRITFGGKEAIQRYAAEQKFSSAETDKLLEFDKLADPWRTPETE